MCVSVCVRVCMYVCVSVCVRVWLCVEILRVGRKRREEMYEKLNEVSERLKKRKGRELRNRKDKWKKKRKDER